MLDPKFYLPWQHTHAQQAFKFLNGRESPRGKLLDFHAAALIEMWDAEASFFLDIWGDEGMAYGGWQWHDDRLTRICNFLQVPKPVRIGPGKFLTRNGLTLEQQVQAVWHELQTSESVAFALLVGTTNAHDAGVVACTKFERAGAHGQAEIRGARTALWLDWMRKNPLPAPGA